MNSTFADTAAPISHSSAMPQSRPRSYRWVDRMAKSLVCKKLNGLRESRVIIYDQEGVSVHGPQQYSLEVGVTINDPRVWSELAFGGSVAAGEAYMDGRWDCDDLTGLIRVFARERDVLIGLDTGSAGLVQRLRNLMYRFQSNTKAGSRRNIEAHYDLSNEFFTEILDPCMQYSSAIYPNADASLDEAQRCKLQVIAQRLDLRAGMHVLEVGTGWGGLAVYLAAEHQVHVTSITISPAQYEFACARVKDAGLEDLVSVRLCDYRDIDGQYDRIVSIEMIEAVGNQFYDTYFETIQRCLATDGLFVMQAITLPHREFHRASKEQDFIKKYIFPGSCIPSVARLAQSADRHNLDMLEQHDFTGDYALTLRAWSRRLSERWDQISGLGFDRRFYRMWQFYFSYCEGGFAERAISVGHLIFAQPAYKSIHHSDLGYGANEISQSDQALEPSRS